MSGAVLFTSCAAVFFILNHARLKDVRGGASAGAWAAFAAALIFSACLAVLPARGIDMFYAVPFMWTAFAVTAAPAMKLGRLAALYTAIFIAAAFSYLLLPYSKMTPLVFILSLVLMLSMTAPVYRELLMEKNVLPAAGVFVLTAMAVHAGVTGRFGPYISVPASLLCAVFLHARKSEPAGYYAQEGNAVNAAGVLLAVLLVQLAVGVFLKSPLFSQ